MAYKKESKNGPMALKATLQSYNKVIASENESSVFYIDGAKFLDENGNSVLFDYINTAPGIFDVDASHISQIPDSNVKTVKLDSSVDEHSPIELTNESEKTYFIVNYTDPDGDRIGYLYGISDDENLVYNVEGLSDACETVYLNYSSFTAKWKTKLIAWDAYCLKLPMVGWLFSGSAFVLLLAFLAIVALPGFGLFIGLGIIYWYTRRVWEILILRRHKPLMREAEALLQR